MIKTLAIENFKSIKELKLDCKRINLFIGEPNAGKSNILEAMGLLSYINYGDGLRGFVRFENMRDLFHDHALDNKVRIGFDKDALEVSFKDGYFEGNYFEGATRQYLVFTHDYPGSGSRNAIGDLSRFKFYRFAVRDVFPNQKSEFLHPPNGDNLLAVILAHKDLRALTKHLFDPFGLRLVLRTPRKQNKGAEAA